jgi:Domain of unknown function (DUF222)
LWRGPSRKLPNLDPDEVPAAEQLLTKHARELGPKDLRLVANRVVNGLDPDGPETSDDQLHQDRRHLELRQRRDGMWHMEGRLTNTVGAQLNAILDPLTRPRTSTVHIDGKTTAIPDERHFGQRMHDAFEDACSRLLLADQPAVGGTPASVIVTVQLDDLLKRAGIAQTSDGPQPSSDQLLRIADEADIWPTIIDKHGVPLAMGRKSRIASRGQTMALIAREGGCSFPGCDHPPQCCDRHHILDWILGGRTDLDNLTLLCRYTTPISCSKAGAAALTPRVCRDGSRPNGSTLSKCPQLNTRIRQLETQRQLQRRRRLAAA